MSKALSELLSKVMMRDIMFFVSEKFSPKVSKGGFCTVRLCCVVFIATEREKACNMQTMFMFKQLFPAGSVNWSQYEMHIGSPRPQPLTLQVLHCLLVDVRSSHPNFYFAGFCERHLDCHG